MLSRKCKNKSVGLVCMCPIRPTRFVFSRNKLFLFDEFHRLIVAIVVNELEEVHPIVES